MLILMQGIPGSGKTTRANEIKNAAESQALMVRVLSTDAYFMRGDRYLFDKEKLGLNHAKCFFETCTALRHKIVDVVILDNCNIKKEHVIKYVAEARAQKRYIYVCKCSEAFKSEHGVPEHTIARMASEMEDLTEIDCVFPF